MPNLGAKHLTKEQKTTILKLHQTGRSTPQIVEVVGCSADQVRYAIKRAGHKPSRGAGGVCYRHADDLRQWASEGVSLSEMGRRIGSTASKIGKFFRRHGIEIVRFRQSRENNPAWRGGRMVDKSGYILLRMPEHHLADSHGYVREHRLVMEQKLGRRLLDSEVVHHRDDDRGNNHPDNLELFATNADHLRETLVGKQPRWTEEGLASIREAWRRSATRRRESIRQTSGPSGGPSR